MSATGLATCDPFVVIEEQREDYVRYRRTDGARWEVWGICDKQGDCAIGAVIDTPDGPVQIRDLAHLRELSAKLERGTRIQTELDVPIGPDATDCCASLNGPLRIVRL